MPNTKKLPTNYTDLPDSIKRLPLENMFNRLEEFQEQKKSGLLNETELFNMQALERCITLRLEFELRLDRFMGLENILSENSESNTLCFKLNDESFIEDFVSKYYFEACQKSTFFITKLSLN